MLIVSNITLASGAWHYYDNRLKGNARKWLGMQSFVLFFAIFVAVYLFSWIRNKYSLRHVETPEIKGKKGSFASYTPE